MTDRSLLIWKRNYSFCDVAEWGGWRPCRNPMLFQDRIKGTIYHTEECYELSVGSPVYFNMRYAMFTENNGYEMDAKLH